MGSGLRFRVIGFRGLSSGFKALSFWVYPKAPGAFWAKGRGLWGKGLGLGISWPRVVISAM